VTLQPWTQLAPLDSVSLSAASAHSGQTNLHVVGMRAQREGRHCARGPVPLPGRPMG
jgi:hypothetical protein